MLVVEDLLFKAMAMYKAALRSKLNMKAGYPLKRTKYAGRRQSRHCTSMYKAGTVYTRQAQHIRNTHSIYQAGKAYTKQAQRNTRQVQGMQATHKLLCSPYTKYGN